MEIRYELKCCGLKTKNDVKKTVNNSICTNIIYVEKGKLTISFCGIKKELNEKESLIIFPCSGISFLDLSGDSPLIYIISYFIPDNELAFSESDAPLCCSPDSELSSVIRNYLSCFRETGFPVSLLKKSLEQSIMYLAETCLSENRKKISEKFASVLLYIHNNYSRNFSVEELCSFAKMSNSGLYNLFYQNLKMSPKQYIRKYRMTLAENMLSITDKTISEISLETGFYDQFYFSKEFKKDFGISPSEYRKTNKI